MQHATTPGLVSQPLLVVFTGIPGTGKTTLAEQAARWLGAPLFSKDEIEATLWRSGILESGKYRGRSGGQLRVS